MHWDYFKGSTGYSNLKTYSQNLSLRTEERMIYKFLIKNEIYLKLLIIGTPEETLVIINFFNETITKKNPRLGLLSEFLLLPNWADIYNSINNKSKLKSPKKTLIYKKRILNSLSKIDDKIVSLGFKKNFIVNSNVLYYKEHKLTIKLIFSFFKQIDDFLKNQIKPTNSRISQIFDYSKFINSTKSWGAYNLTKELNINVCPYCNRNYVHTLETSRGKTRPELDHYFPKSRFPFLALSLFNLIPSCHICNSNLKGSKDFYKENHMHPYMDDFNDAFHFKIEYLDKGTTLPIISDLDKFNIKIEITSDNEGVIEKITNSNSTFKIEELYNFHKDVAKELVQKSIYYNKTRLEELNNFKDKDGNNLFENRNEVSRFVIGNYIDTDKLGQRTLAKFTRDLILRTELGKLVYLK